MAGSGSEASNANESDLVELVRERGREKGKLTRINTFLDSKSNAEMCPELAMLIEVRLAKTEIIYTRMS